MIWSEFIVLAEELARKDSAAARRSAVSRAYYGALNSSRIWVETNFGPIEHGSLHRRVWRTFTDAPRAAAGTRRDWAKVAELGHELRKLRNQADYAGDMPGLDRRAPEAVATAKQIIALLAELELGV